ncbi:hypothetical protein [Paramicrobacterium chengjingii]|uniref:Tryptophan-rich sensory protein n=1 Tax=Paramicrobacterium chengjingii TaxID=2769067 RepID=A0ABX6YMD1_9MICO|nr:hypothetical protein [Microbacterium chengjingii]QPZ39467.1 hypothetical protein HCR76_05260 [Microbacterium chengjingii]
MSTSRTRSFIAGVLVANSAPHLATAAAGRQHLTPLGGRQSGPGINAIWGALNLAAGVALLAKGRRGAGAQRGAASARWTDDLPSFETGYLVFAAWMAISERLMKTNHGTSGRQNRAQRRR